MSKLDELDAAVRGISRPEVGKVWCPRAIDLDLLIVLLSGARALIDIARAAKRYHGEHKLENPEPCSICAALARLERK